MNKSTIAHRVLQPQDTVSGRWSDWRALVRIVPELQRLLDEVRAHRRVGRRLDRIWSAPGNIRAQIRMAINRALYSGATLPFDSELIAVDCLHSALIEGVLVWGEDMESES